MSPPAIVATVASLLSAMLDALPCVVDVADLAHETQTHVVCVTIIAAFVFAWAIFDRLVPKAVAPRAGPPAQRARFLPITVVEHFLTMQGKAKAAAKASRNWTKMESAGFKVVDVASWVSPPPQIKVSELATFMEHKTPITIHAARTLATDELKKHSTSLISHTDCKQLMAKCNVERKYNASMPETLKGKGILQIVKVNDRFFIVGMFKYPGCTGHVEFVNWVLDIINPEL
jgi:hypothetical protein